MELRSSSQEGIHRGGFNNNLSTHSLPKERSSNSKLPAAAASNIPTTVIDRRRNHGGSSSTTVVLNQHPPRQTLDPHLTHPHLLLPPQYSNNLPHPQTNSNPDPQDLIIAPPPSSNEPIVTSTNTTTASVEYIYGECLKNHVASTGGHVVDGCGEFMPGGEENTPEALRCAACDCHRNFHRRQVQGQVQENNITSQIPSSAGNNNNHISHRITTSQHHHHHLQHQQHHNASRYAHGGLIPPPSVMMAFRGGGAAEYSSSEELNVFRYNYDGNNNNNNNGGGTTTQAGKKRCRTKFSQGQKERMQEFADRVGWKMQKQDDEAVEKFCEEVGVKRQVFKVWMHNNKAAINKNKQVVLH